MTMQLSLTTPCILFGQNIVMCIELRGSCTWHVCVLASADKFQTKQGLEILIHLGGITKAPVSVKHFSIIYACSSNDIFLISPHRLEALINACCFQVDAVLNSTTTNLDLTWGQISSSLLRAAGPEMQNECNTVRMLGRSPASKNSAQYLVIRLPDSLLMCLCFQVKPNGITYADIAVTSGYKLPCKYVFHGSCPSWDRGTSLQVQL